MPCRTICQLAAGRRAGGLHLMALGKSAKYVDFLAENRRNALWTRR
jgi:hypothetical protein